MVDATVLADYEIWFLIASVLSSAVVGFLVAFLQDTTKKPLLYMTLVWVVLLALVVWMTISKRRKLQKKSKEITLRAFEATANHEED